MGPVLCDSSEPELNSKHNAFILSALTADVMWPAGFGSCCLDFPVVMDSDPFIFCWEYFITATEMSESRTPPEFHQEPLPTEAEAALGIQYLRIYMVTNRAGHWGRRLRSRRLCTKLYTIIIWKKNLVGKKEGWPLSTFSLQSHLELAIGVTGRGRSTLECLQVTNPWFIRTLCTHLIC